MDQTPDDLIARVRARRRALDTDLELLRMRTRASVRAAALATRLAGVTRTMVPVAIGAATLLLWGLRRRALRSAANEGVRGRLTRGS